MAELLSINVGGPRAVVYQGRFISTGIFKTAVDGPVALSPTNLAGDGQADLNNHGGEDKAVYCFAHEQYAHWADQLDRDDFTLGQFGENFTTTGLSDTEVCVGDIYRVGETTVQVTQPREPCYKLGIRMKDAALVKRFLARCQVGFYLRVLQTGMVTAGDEIELLTPDPQRMTVESVCRLLFFDRDNRAAIEKVLTIEGLSDAWRGAFESIRA